VLAQPHQISGKVCLVTIGLRLPERHPQAGPLFSQRGVLHQQEQAGWGVGLYGLLIIPRHGKGGLLDAKRMVDSFGANNDRHGQARNP